MDLQGEQGRSIVCKATKGAEAFDVKVTVTSVDGDTINFTIERVGGPAAVAPPAAATPDGDPADAPSTSGYPVRDPDTSIRAFRDQVLEAVRTGEGAALVDVRSPEEYRGEKLAPDHLPQEAAQRPGHIPGAANIPWAKAVDPEKGTFLPAGQLRSLYEGQGLTPDREVIAYCRIGERSSHTWFVLKELLGVENVKNYDGSWTEYGSLVGVPVALGDEAGEA